MNLKTKISILIWLLISLLNGIQRKKSAHISTTCILIKDGTFLFVSSAWSKSIVKMDQRDTLLEPLVISKSMKVIWWTLSFYVHVLPQWKEKMALKNILSLELLKVKFTNMVLLKTAVFYKTWQWSSYIKKVNMLLQQLHMMNNLRLRWQVHMLAMLFNCRYMHNPIKWNKFNVSSHIMKLW